MGVVAQTVQASIRRHVAKWCADLPSLWPAQVSRTASVKPIILVLDLDETLLRPKIERAHPLRKLSRVDVRVYLEGGIQCSASFRPGLDEFFQWIRARRDSGLIEGPWIFGQGAKVYVDAMVRELDPFGDLFEGRVLSNEACTPLTKPWPWVVKDLSKIPCSSGDALANLPRTVLVENNSLSCMLFPDNSVLVRDWLGDGNEEDNELARVSALIDELIDKEAAEHTGGNYVRHLASATPGYSEFRERLAVLGSRFEEPPPAGASLKDAYGEVWREARQAKEALLGLKAGHC